MLYFKVQANMDNLDTRLAQLENAQLVRRSAEEDLTYLFKHALVQDAAYNTLLKHERKRLHGTIGEALETTFPQQLDENAARLGQHFFEAGDHERAARYFMRAGDLAQRLFAPVEARLHYSRALESLSQLADTDDNRRLRVETTTKYAMAAFVSEAPEQILARLVAVESLAQPLNRADAPGNTEERLLIARLHFWIGRMHLISNQPLEGIKYYQQVLSEAEGLGDEELLAVPSGEIGMALARQGRYGQAIPLLEPAIAYLDKTGNVPQWTYLAAHLAFSLVARGQVAAGFALGESILSRAQALKAPSGVAVSKLFLSFIYQLGGDTQRSLRAASDCIELAQRTGELLLVNLAYGYQAWAESRLGNHAVARQALTRQEETAQRLGGQFVLPDHFAAFKAEVALNEGCFEEAISLAERAVKIAEPMEGVFALGFAQRIWAEALMALAPGGVEGPNSSYLAESEAHLTASLHAFESGDCLVEAARTHAAWGKLCQARGDHASAREHFGQAAEVFQASGLDAELQRMRRDQITGKAGKPNADH
jgi:tetratricopeptide (TPR) repeat protein